MRRPVSFAARSSQRARRRCHSSRPGGCPVRVLVANAVSRRDDEETGTDAFRVYGHSKDHRDDLPRIVIGLAVTKQGIPVRVWCWPGNTNDQALLPEVRDDDMRGWRLGRVITVVDRGFSSAENLAYLRRAGGHFIAGMRMRDGNPLVEQVLSRQGRYQQVKDNLRVKEVHLDDSDVRFVICHNPEQGECDRAHREDAITRLRAELGRIKQARERNRKRKTSNNAKARTRQKAEAARTKAECALRDHPTLGRWLRQSTTGRLSINRAKIKQEQRLDGNTHRFLRPPHQRRGQRAGLLTTEQRGLRRGQPARAEPGARRGRHHADALTRGAPLGGRSAARVCRAVLAVATSFSSDSRTASKI